MHLGRVLVLRGKPAEAADELRQVTFGEADSESRYFKEMFLGAAEEGAGRFDAAREAYVRAADIESGAQSPYLALSALAVRQGDRKGALREIDHVLAMPAAVERHSTDSWWVYRVTQARRVDELFEALYGSLQEKTP
jgi:Flp pilus assembly protein TadD